jgi:hypothetical protein
MTNMGGGITGEGEPTSSLEFKDAKMNHLSISRIYEANFSAFLDLELLS